jgi:hypothetical protein
VVRNVSWRDQLCFASTCSALWEASLPALETFRSECEREWRWYDQRLICLADDSDRDVDDLPPGLLTEAEKVTLREDLAEDKDGDGLVQILSSAWSTGPHTSNKDVAKHIRDLKIGKVPAEALLAACVSRPPPIKRGQKVVLRNLSKRVYVRQSAIDELPEGIDLGYVIVPRSLYSRLSCLCYQTRAHDPHLLVRRRSRVPRLPCGPSRRPSQRLMGG